MIVILVIKMSIENWCPSIMSFSSQIGLLNMLKCAWEHGSRICGGFSPTCCHKLFFVFFFFDRDK